MNYRKNITVCFKLFMSLVLVISFAGSSFLWTGGSGVFLAATASDSQLAEYQSLPGTGSCMSVTDAVCNDTLRKNYWNARTNLQIGDQSHSDRSQIVMSSIPNEFLGMDWIRTAMVSRDYSQETIYEFTLTVSTDIFVAWDTRMTAAGWLQSYQSTGKTIATKNLDNDSITTFGLYKKTVTAGDRVSLGSFGNGSNAMYFVLIDYKSADPVEIRPAITGLTVNDLENAADWSISENLAAGDAVYGDTQSIVFGSIPAELTGATVINPSSDSRRWDGDNMNTLCSFVAGRNGYVYIAYVAGNLPSWLNDSGFEDAAAVINAGAATYNLYSKYVYAGTTVSLGKQLDDSRPMYIPMFTAKAIGKTPDVPTISRLAVEGLYAPGWHFVIENLNADSDLYTYNNASNRRIAVSVPDEYRGLDYLQTYNPTKSNIFFFLERKTEVCVTWDMRNSVKPSWLQAESWSDTEKTLTATNGSGTNYTYMIFSKVFQAGECVTLSAMTGSYDNHIAIFRPLGEANEKAKNPVVPQGVEPDMPETEYKYYADDVFNLDNSIWDSGYSLKGGKAEIVPNAADRFVKLSASGGGAAVLEKRFSGEIKKRAVFEFKVFPTAAGQRIRLNNKSGAASVTLEFESGTGSYLNLTATDGSQATDIMTGLPAQTWYTVKLVADSETRSYEVWVNHLRKVQALDLQGTGYISAISFEVSSLSTGSLSIDNVYAYDDTEVYKMREDFDGMTSGEATQTADWYFTDNAAVAITDLPFATDKSLMLSAQNGVAAEKRLPAGLTGRLTAEIKIKPVGTEFTSVQLSDNNNRIAVSIGFFRNNIYACDGDNWIKVLDGEAPWCYYPANNWYVIAFRLNTFTNRYDLYIDGVLREKDLSFAEDADTIDLAAVSLYGYNTAYLNYIDIAEGFGFGREMFPDKIVLNVKDAPYYAKGDGITNDTAAVQKALDDAAHTGATVLLENGVFLTSMLRLKDDTTFFVDTSATLLGIKDKYAYEQVVDTTGRVNSNQVGKALIYIGKASNVRVEGGGTIDGNGFYDYSSNDPGGANRRPTIILAALSYDVTLRNLRLVNSPFWTLVPMESTNMTIKNVDIYSPTSINRDGIDPTDLINATIENCKIIAADDALCFKSSNNYGCRNIDVRNMLLQSTVANGIKFGTDAYDDLENVLLEDITIKNARHSAVVIEAIDGANVINLRLERIDITDSSNSLYFQVSNRLRTPPGGVKKSAGYIKDVVIKDFNYTNPRLYPFAPSSNNGSVNEMLFLGLGNSNRISNVLLENVYLELSGSYSTAPGVPSGSGTGYPEQERVGQSNASAFCLKYCTDFTFVNNTVVLLSPDVRPLIAQNYYTGAAISGIG